MKSQKPVHTLFAAFLLLIGISSASAVACTSSKFAGTVSTCDCPDGTAPSGSYSPALPVDTYGGAANDAAQLTNFNTAVAKCTDLLPGWKKATGTSLPTKCVIADGYCPGMQAAFKTGVWTIVGTTGNTDATGFTAITGAYTDLAGAGDKAFLQSSKPIDCPANSGGINTPKTVQTSTAASTGSVWPFTIDKCKVTPGYYVVSVTGTNAAVISPCPVDRVCPVGMHAGSPLIDPTEAAYTCITAAAGNAQGTVGGFICPKWTYGTLGTTLAASLAGITGEVVCGAGTGPKTGTCYPLAGNYGVDSVTGVAATACPTGITGAASSRTLATACTKVAPGYTVLADIPAQFVVGPVTSLTAGITACAENSHCPGGDAAKIALVGASASEATFARVEKHAGAFMAVKCPPGTGNTLTGASAQGINAISGATACIDLLPGYSFLGGVTFTTAAHNFNTIVGACPANKYNCAGSANFFVDYSDAKITLPAGTGTGAAGLSMVIADTIYADDGTTKSLLASDITSLATGSLIMSGCPGGSKNTVAAGPISSCLLNPGKYIDHSDLNAPATCPDGKYCPGGGKVGTAGGDNRCPAGSEIISESTSVLNSNINECSVSKGFYIAAADLNLPVPCPTASACAGGGVVGVAGGMVACPTGSTNAQCIAAGAPSTTVNLTPASQPITTNVAAPTVAAAAAPDVTVTNTVPSASSAASTVASMVVVTVAAMVAL